MAQHWVDWLDAFPASCRGGAIAIGNFDGAHRGHAALITQLVKLAATVSGPAVAIMFDPHPVTLIRPEVNLITLTTPTDRALFLQRLGADEVVILQTTPALLNLDATAFFHDVIRRQLSARGVVEGANFSFGRNRQGNISLLDSLCRKHGMVLQIVEPITLDGREISSSRIRTLLAEGNVRQAGVLLGRCYHVRGIVQPGQRRGRLLGFPTANLEKITTVLPKEGVYACRVNLPGSTEGWPAAVNLGPNPTFDEQERKFEVHLIGFEGDLYGQELCVEFVDRLRDTRPFKGIPDLTSQLQQDVARVAMLLGENKSNEDHDYEFR